MKKISIILLLSISFTTVQACEICGCGLGNYYVGLLPQFKHNFLGLRYQHRQFHTVMAENTSQYSKDYFSTVELWGGWNIGKKWQVLAILPVNFIHQVSDDGVTNQKGVGDIAVMANYKLWEKNGSSAKGKQLQQQIWIGGGIKLPTGQFNVDAADPALVSIANTQTGSASVDYMINGMYDLRINKWGINTSLSYKLNAANKDKYSFGDKFTAQSILSYKIQKGNSIVMPNLGLQLEHSSANQLDKQIIAATGGHVFSTAIGIEWNYKKITLGANLQKPLAQNLSDKQTTLNYRGMAHLTYSF